MSEELAAIEGSTVRAGEDRKQAAELLAAISRQVCVPPALVCAVVRVVTRLAA